MPITELAANHLWQSTAFAAVAALLALALRANHARARYWLWLAASVKFLVPFSALAAIGGGLGRWLAPAAPVTRLPLVMEQIVQPFGPVQDAAVPAAVSAPPPNVLPALLLAIWFCGFAAVLRYAWTRWRRVAAAVRSSTPLTEGRELEALGRLQKKAGQEARPTVARRRFGWGGPPGLPSVVSSTAKLEPGVFGVFRPVLWLPAGIGDRLEDAELEAILTHELCHIRRRDNLLASIHMLVEALFWFHPLLWWLGARLEEERERACDEEVVRMGGEPQIYAESILKVVEFYLASPVACAAGITGGELKKRIEGIMTSRFPCELSFGKKLLLAATAFVVAAGPVVVGLMSTPPSRAQSRAAISAPQAHTPVAIPGADQPATAVQPPSEVARSQAETEPLPAFEVASVKRTSECTYERSMDPGQVALKGMPLNPVLIFAFGVSKEQIIGPSWLESDCFDVFAKSPQGSTADQIPAMLRALLAERFKLSAHKESRPSTIYALVVDKGGPKIKQAAENSTFMGNYPRKAFATGRGGRGILKGIMTMELLAKGLSVQGYGQIVDDTGLKGEYEISLSWVPDQGVGQAAPSAAASDPGADLFAAVRESLGLRLEPRKTQTEALVIDHIERVPTEN